MTEGMTKKKVTKKDDGFIGDLKSYFFNFVLFYFQTVNRKVRARITFKKIKSETSEHFYSLIRALKMFFLPASLCYLFIGIVFLKTVLFSSLFWGLIIFVYSNYLPDLPAIFRRRNNDANQKLPWYKTYALLFFTPLLIYPLFTTKNGMLSTTTSETFHNFKSMMVYGIFLLLIGFIFCNNLLEAFSPATFGLLGYFVHLKTDHCLSLR